MLLTRWQPITNLWTEMNRLHHEMNRLFESYGLEHGWPGLAVAFPAINIWQDEDSVFAEAELPGMELKDLEIYVTGGDQLTIKGQRKQPEVKEGVWHRQERGFGTFTRVLTLPADVDADRVEARFHQGVLTITMPKSETARPRKITVRAQ